MERPDGSGISCAKVRHRPGRRGMAHPTLLLAARAAYSLPDLDVVGLGLGLVQRPWAPLLKRSQPPAHPAQVIAYERGSTVLVAAW